MKKIGFLVLAIVLAIGTLGVGYAMWYQTLTINGTVSTGSVNLKVDNFSGTWAYKNITEESLLFQQELGYGPDNRPALPDDGDEYSAILGYAEIASETGWEECTEANGNIDLTIDTHNMFPASDSTMETNPGDRDWTVDFRVCNTGTVPVKFQLVDYWAEGLENFDALFVTTDESGREIMWMGSQLEPNDCIDVVLHLFVDEETNQGIDGVFHFVIAAVQWNEYGEPLP